MAHAKSLPLNGAMQTESEESEAVIKNDSKEVLLRMFESLIVKEPRKNKSSSISDCRGKRVPKALSKA